MENTNSAFAELSRFAAGLRYADISAHDRSYLNLLLADYYGAILAGYRINPGLNAPLQNVVMQMGGTEESSIIFSEKKIPACNAALLHGCYAMGAEMDDGNRKAGGHPGATVMSSVFALAETLDVTEQEVLTAIAVGYEFMCRLAASTQPGQGARGFHPTGMTGTIASAAACTKLLGLGEASFHTAIALAVLQANGILTTETFKPLSPGKAAQSGVLTARLVAEGAQGGPDALKKSNRWFRAVSELYDPAEITDGLGEGLRLSECYIKLYPACRHLHGAIDAALAMREDHDPFKAEAITVSLYKSGFDKATDIIRPKNSAEAKFSTAYTAACAFLNGRFGFDDLEVDKADPRVWTLADKFRFVRDDSLEDRAAGIRGVRMEMVIDGKSHECMFPLPKGDPEWPVTLEEVRQKMGMCAGNLLSEAAVDELFDTVTGLGEDRRFQAVRILSH